MDKRCCNFKYIFSTYGQPLYMSSPLQMAISLLFANKRK